MDSGNDVHARELLVNWPSLVDPILPQILLKVLNLFVVAAIQHVTLLHGRGNY